MAKPNHLNQYEKLEENKSVVASILKESRSKNPETSPVNAALLFLHPKFTWNAPFWLWFE